MFKERSYWYYLMFKEWSYWYYVMFTKRNYGYYLMLKEQSYWYYVMFKEGTETGQINYFFYMKSGNIINTNLTIYTLEFNRWTEIHSEKINVWDQDFQVRLQILDNTKYFQDEHSQLSCRALLCLLPRLPSSIEGCRHVSWCSLTVWLVYGYV